MAEITTGNSSLGGSLQSLLMAQDIQPGSAPSYQLCKTLYSYHVLGAKLAEAPIKLAQSQERIITVPLSPEERVVEAFKREWKALNVNRHIFNTMRLARVYGIASVVVLGEGVNSDTPIDADWIVTKKISFNILDPLNTSGSLVLNQDPNAVDFQKHAEITVAGVTYHRSRSCVVLNEEPIYIEYTNSGFGYVGRSVYQRALFPLKSFINTMRADDMVSRKAGFLIAKIKQTGAVANQMMARAFGLKRDLIKEGETDNVLNVGPDDSIETLNMQNVNGAMSESRKNILENIASAAPMPALMLSQETIAQGLAEGGEDAKVIAHFIDGVRVDMHDLYDFFDQIVMRRAWNKDFYATIQDLFPESYGKMEYKDAFYQWKNSFSAEWPSLLTEPDSEKIKVEETKFKSAIAAVEVLLPNLDPTNKVKLIQFLADSFNANKLLFPDPLILDWDALEEYVEEQTAKQEEMEAQQAAMGAPGGADTSEGSEGAGAPAKEPAAPKPFAQAA